MHAVFLYLSANNKPTVANGTRVACVTFATASAYLFNLNTLTARVSASA